MDQSNKSGPLSINQIAGYDSAYDSDYHRELKRIKQEMEHHKMREMEEYARKFKDFHDRNAKEQWAKEYLGGFPKDSRPKMKPSSKDQLKKRIQIDLDRSQKRVDEDKQLLENIDKIKFNAGDAVLHKTMGNVIIKGIFLKSEVDAYNIANPADWSDGYVYEVIGVEGTITAREQDLMPITTVTQNLYNE